MGLVQQRLDKHAHDLDVALPLLRVFADRAHPGDQQVTHQAIVDGERLAGAMHTGPAHAFPSRAVLAEWQICARSLIQKLKAAEPQVVEEYVQRLDSKKDRRLIRSM